MTKMRSTILVAPLVLALAGCSDRMASSEINDGSFGNATMNNSLVHMGAVSATQALGQRFAAEVEPTITFPFDSAALTPESQMVLSAQADWIRQFPEVRFRVYGHTDLVGSTAYNKALGLRRAKAVVAYFASQGINPSRLEALVSYGETRPVIPVSTPEERNRRTVTEVSGFVGGNRMTLNGKYAAIVFREYVAGAKRVHPSNRVIATQVAPGG
ncbi:OmpA family protein [Rhodobacter sp. NSM]|uniref:OmpA family protein n=1 Tax=Rhodobacter sp. NSM TaxID=3457501 RepID=UPI003FD4DDB8